MRTRTKSMIPTRPAVAIQETTQRELFFMIAPQRHIKSDVSVLKDDVHYLIGHSYESHHSVAHISLFQFDDQENMKDMMRFVQKKCASFQPFNVFLKDFGVFQHGSKRTIYMDIVNKYPIQDIFDNLVKKGANYTPHIPIAKNLNEEDFLKCWPYLKGLKYSNQHFTCDRITVLSREKGGKWTHYKDIMFGE